MVVLAATDHVVFLGKQLHRGGLSRISRAGDKICVFEVMLQKTGYLAALEAEGIEGKERAENVKELLSGIIQYENENDTPSLSGYLEEIALVSDIDSYSSDADSVVLMTIHSAKGLEFKKVFLVGMEEGIFPGNQTIYGGTDEMEEERRLAYVAITRAKEKLTITNADMRMLYGMTSRNLSSRFVREIPENLCDIKGKTFKTITSGAINYDKKKSNYDYSTVFQPPKVQMKSEVGKFTVGMRIEHKTFGEGMITKVTPMGNDSMLEIAFDTVGTKKIMAGYAKLKILN